MALRWIEREILDQEARRTRLADQRAFFQLLRAALERDEWDARVRDRREREDRHTRP